MNLYNLSPEQDKKLDFLVKENNTLSFQLDILSKKLSKAIQLKTEEEAEALESHHLEFDLNLINNEIETLESEKKSFLTCLTETNDLQSQINRLKSHIKTLETQNQVLRSIPSVSGLYEELLGLKAKELELRTSLKKQKRKIAKFHNSDPRNESNTGFVGLSATPDVLMQLSKNRELQYEQKRVKMAWEMVLSEADSKKKELEDEIAELSFELKTRTRSLNFGLSMASISIVSPSDLAEEYPKGIESSLGNFGNPPYNTKIIGLLWYPALDQDGCSPLSFVPHDMETDHYIFMFDRGNCSYSLKVKHAQDIGVRSVLIANSIENEPVSNIIMRDNRMGGNLFIPAMMISKEDGLRLKQALKQSSVTLKLGFELPKSPERISLSLVLSSGNEQSQDFMKTFYEVGQLFSHSTVDLDIHYVVIQCIACKNSGFAKAEENCLGGGRYCAPDPDDLIGGGLSGRNVIQEDLRQKCLLRALKEQKQDFSYSNFFLFLKRFSESCSLKLNDPKCSEGIMKQLGFDVKKVHKCYEDSFEGGDEALDVNRGLDQEIEFWKNNGLHEYPSVFINHYLFRGDLEPSALLTAVCAGYQKKYLPDFCRSQDSANVVKGYSTATVVFGLLLFFGVLVAVLVVYRHVAKRELERDMRRQVNLAVNQYIALNDIANNKVIERQTVRSSYV